MNESCYVAIHRESESTRAACRWYLSRRSLDYLNASGNGQLLEVVDGQLNVVSYLSLTSVNNSTVAGKCNARAKAYAWYDGWKVTIM
jgi:hypothetical protein